MLTFLCLLFLGLPIFLAVVILTGDASYAKKTRNTLKEIMEKRNITNYNWEQFNDGKIILNDGTNRMFHFAYGNGFLSIRHEDITGVELIIDDSVAYQSSISSAVGRAIVGGVLAGGVGAIIGGVTGKKNGKKLVNKIELIVTHRYTGVSSPYIKITLLNSREGEDIFGHTYQKQYDAGLRWSKTIENLMDRQY